MFVLSDINLLSTHDTLTVQESNPTAFFLSIQDDFTSPFLLNLCVKLTSPCLSAHLQSSPPAEEALQFSLLLDFYSSGHVKYYLPQRSSKALRPASEPFIFHRNPLLSSTFMCLFTHLSLKMGCQLFKVKIPIYCFCISHNK